MSESVDSKSSSRALKRDPDQVMKLARLGSFFQTRLSFMRVLLRRLKREQWRFKINRWDINDQGFGRAVYTVYGPEHNYSLVAFSRDLPASERSDRVIATAWDMSFALFDGIPDEADLQRLQANVPRQEAGRINSTELSLSRANKSVRLWDHVVESLSTGQQPDEALINSTGYLVRTTAVYGSGKFGAADRQAICDRAELKGPFQLEMLAVWLIRSFAIDLVEFIAERIGGKRSVRLAPHIRHHLGVGNSTGLGMAPFLINHPVLLDHWIDAREEAISRVRGLPSATESEIARFNLCLDRFRKTLSQWHSQHELQQQRLLQLAFDVKKLDEKLAGGLLQESQPWQRLIAWSESELGIEAQELVLSLMLEPYPALVDELASDMDADEDAEFAIDGAMTVGSLQRLINTNYAWVFEYDFKHKKNLARFWYSSEEKLEPRVGERFDEPGADLEQPLGVARDVQRLAALLEGMAENQILAQVLLAHPEFRHVVRRIQIQQFHPYSEIRDNLLSAEMLPIDLLRCKLSFFGATRFDPRSDRWVRICMYQDAPFPSELLQAVD